MRLSKYIIIYLYSLYFSNIFRFQVESLRLVFVAGPLRDRCLSFGMIASKMHAGTCAIKVSRFNNIIEYDYQALENKIFFIYLFIVCYALLSKTWNMTKYNFNSLK